MKEHERQQPRPAPSDDPDATSDLSQVRAIRADTERMLQRADAAMARLLSGNSQELNEAVAQVNGQ